ncbi:MAG: non-canonical purine NTP pyrophosphatase [Phycisphaerae bacterium]|nr:non-canonical purine NTP pyrophosphatase [Phycisphaerae bacterium]
MDTIIIATGNPHKVSEVRAILGDLGIAARIIGLADAGGPFAEPAEIGATFETNARIKALEYARQTGGLCLVDDSGLEIDALGGRPGVISSHYCSDGREEGLPREERDRLNNARVLRELSGVPPAARSARFVCEVCLAEPGRVLARARGFFDGRIGVPPGVPRGAAGFGYDPIFLVAPGYNTTSAELPTEEKNRLSHRGAALRAMASEIRRMR